MTVCVNTDFGVDAVECNSSTVPSDEEVDWLPNPYQALADAQVLAGAWPGSPMLITGTPVLIGAAHGLGGAPPTPEAHAQRWVPAEVVIDDGSCWSCSMPSGDDDSYWGSSLQTCRNMAASWNVLHDFSKGSLAESCETHTPSCQDDLRDSFDRSSGSNTPVEPLEVDDHSAPGVRVTGYHPRKLSHRCVPKGTDLGERFGEKEDRNEITTLMIRNIPNMYTRSMLVEELDSLDFGGEYDFLYLPIDKSTQWNVGYAFVNFKSPEVAQRCMSTMASYVFRCYEHGSGKVTQISPAHIQGLERNLAYYSKTAVQCAGSQTNRPLVLSAGCQEGSDSGRRPHRRRRRARAAAHAFAAAA